MSILKLYINSLPESERETAEKRINELSKVGFSDEQVIADLLSYEKEKGIKPKKKSPAYMYDKMNYMCRKYMDRMARVSVRYDYTPDIDKIKDIILCIFELSPVFHSSFKDNHISPYWITEKYTADDIFTVSEADDLDEAVDSFLEQYIDFGSNVQFRVGIFTKGNETALAFYWNHMLMDGGGFHQFFADLSRSYTEYVNKGTFTFNFRIGTRHHAAVYDEMEPQKAKKAKTQLSNVSPREKKTLPFTKRGEGDSARIVHKTVSADIFARAFSKAKALGATGNDMLIAVYADACKKMLSFEGDISISSALDLRRHMKNPDNIGYTNHTTFMPCTIEKVGEDITETLRLVTESTKKSKADEFLGLHGLPLLNFAYNAMIYAQAEPIVKFFYNNAHFGLSNIGELNKKIYSLDGNEPISGFVAGAAKKKPFTFVTALTVRGVLYLTMSIDGSEKDEKMVGEFFDCMEDAFIRLGESE